MLGQAVPNFSLASTVGTTATLSALRGETLVLPFHSRQKMRFPFELLADLDEALCKQFAVVKLKTLSRSQVLPRRY
jgi:peroxiredoxin